MILAVIIKKWRQWEFKTRHIGFQSTSCGLK